MPIVIAVVIVLVLLALVSVLSFNGLRAADQGVQKDYNNITTELQRRAELIPNLVTAVKQYAAHESGVFEAVTAARVKADAVPTDPAHAADLAAAQAQVGGSLARLVAVAENYPDLKASQNFLSLQAELTDTEDRIAASRKLYNSSVEHLNTKIRTFPSLLFVGAAKVTVAQYYTVDEARRAELDKPVDLGGMF